MQPAGDPGGGAPPPAWSNYLQALPREVRDLLLFRYLDGAVANRAQYSQLLLEVARVFAQTPGGAALVAQVVAGALAPQGPGLHAAHTWAAFLNTLPAAQRDQILYTYLAAVVHNRTQYADLLATIVAALLAAGDPHGLISGLVERWAEALGQG
jgi:hypothetical protein